jgi:Flp pilus assembly secretin CpaC
VPALGDIPIIGALFRSQEYQTSRTELVILVTPELVEPLSPDQVTFVPGTQMIQPNDFEFYIEGKLEGTPDADRPALTPRIHYPWPTGVRQQNEEEIGMKLIGPCGPAGYDEGL